MKSPLGMMAVVGIINAFIACESDSQSLPVSLSFTVAGAFANGVADSGNSILITDNNLTNGYASGMDLQDAPLLLVPTGPVGSAAFQWGSASGVSSYPHSSALWFRPIAATDVGADQYFNIGVLYYRNGTIRSNTGASAVNINLALNFSSPAGLAPLNTSFSTNLINTVNTNDPVASADIVSFSSQASPLDFTDASGNKYFLELSFKVDQTTIDGTLSTPSEFRVFEGGQGSANLLGRFTTTPIPEPSSALLASLCTLSLIRRRR